MKTSDQDTPGQDRDNGKHEQENVDSRDHARQREAAVKDAEAVAKKQKDPGK